MSVQYTLDAAGNRVAVAAAAGRLMLDALNRITGLTYANWDVASHSYDAAGNLIAAGADTCNRDWNGSSPAPTVGGTTVNYAYDGRGVRVSETVGATTTNFLWDRAAGLPLLIDDGTNGYLHADGLIAEIGSSGAPTYHLTDALGSVRGLTDLTGVLTGTTSFDVFGDIRGQTGATSVFGFTGEQRDAVTGLTYLRARYYAPELGRFLSADTVQPSGPGTQGFNRYAYVGNNPCTATDPSGHVPKIALYQCMAAVALAYANLIKSIIPIIVAPKRQLPITIEMWTEFGIALLALFLAIGLCLVVMLLADSGSSGPSPNPPDSTPTPNPPGPLPPTPPIPGDPSRA